MFLFKIIALIMALHWESYKEEDSSADDKAYSVFYCDDSLPNHASFCSSFTSTFLFLLGFSDFQEQFYHVYVGSNCWSWRWHSMRFNFR